jgi:hypothetical protein
MSAHTLRPRSVTELLDAAFHLYRAHLGPFVLLGAGLLLPFVVLGIAFAVAVMPVMAEAGGAGGDFDVTPFLWFYALMPVALCWIAIADAAMQVAASDAYLKGEVAAGRALRLALSRGWRIIGATLLKYIAVFAVLMVGGIAVGIGAAISPVLAVVLGIGLMALFPYVYGRVALVPSTCVLEDSGASRALERAVQLSNENGWRIVGGLFLVYLVLMVVQFTVLFGVAAMGMPIVGQVLGQLVWMVAYPLVAVLTMLFYYDLRIRKEGFDLEVMSADLARLPEPPGAASPMTAAGARRIR